MKKYNFIEVFTGVVVVAVVAFCCTYAYKKNNKDISKTYEIYALFDRVDGITEGSDIKISGVKVGYVRDFFVDPKTFRAKVILCLKDDIKIPAESSAEVVSESLLGGKYITINPGFEEKTMEEGETITQTQSSVNFEGLISRFLVSPPSDVGKQEGTKEKPSSGKEALKPEAPHGGSLVQSGPLKKENKQESSLPPLKKEAASGGSDKGSIP